MGRPKGSKNRVSKTLCSRGHALVGGYCSPCAILRANRWKKKNPKRRREICRNWYWNTPAQYRDNLKKMASAERREIRTWIGAIKLKAGCADCGYRKYAEALDFDHLRDKTHDVGGMCNARFSKERILLEIGKCEVVCANCHRHRTWLRHGNIEQPAADVPFRLR